MKKSTILCTMMVLAAAAGCCVMLGGPLARADAQSELDAALAKIDMALYEQSVSDIRAWLDERIKRTGDFGVYNFGWMNRHYLKIDGDAAHLDLNRGGFADAAAQLLCAYEILGDSKYLEAGLKTADFYLAVQQPAGHFPTGATVHSGGKITIGGGKHAQVVARMEDGYQFRRPSSG